MSYAGTHDVQNVSVFSPHPGEIRVTGDFVERSNATAALLVVYSTSSNNSDTIYHVVSCNWLGGKINVTFNASTGGSYKVSVFALENGRPFPRVVAFPRPVHVHVAMDSSYEFEGIMALVSGCKCVHNLQVVHHTLHRIALEFIYHL